MRTQKIRLVLVAFTSIMLSFASFAQEVKTNISVDFKIKNLGLNVNGFFGDVSITNNFSSKNTSEWTLEGIIKVNSIITGIKKRDKHLLEPDYFNAIEFPEIKLEATNFKKFSNNKYNVTAKLTIKETTKTITIPVGIKNSETEMQLQTHFEVNRRDYGIGGKSFSMSNTVKITVNYTLIKQ